jgi:lipopolysaccharide export system ATP-binding protein
MNNQIYLENIKKKFKSKIALNGISIGFSQKKINGLLGPNGSGKTTLFNLIAGFIKPDSGEIFFDNKNIKSLHLNERSKIGISYLPQEPSVFRDLNVYDNILSIAELFHDKKNSIVVTEELIKLFSLNKFSQSKGKVLSGGERRRTEIARALASNPKFLLLDEPFAGIDPIAIEDVKETILKLKVRGIGIIITDHNVREALKVVDHAEIIYNGEIIKSGEPRDIIEDKFVKKIYLGENYKTS